MRVGGVFRNLDRPTVNQLETATVVDLRSLDNSRPPEENQALELKLDDERYAEREGTPI